MSQIQSGRPADTTKQARYCRIDSETRVVTTGPTSFTIIVCCAVPVVIHTCPSRLTVGSRAEVIIDEGVRCVARISPAKRIPRAVRALAQIVVVFGTINYEAVEKEISKERLVRIPLDKVQDVAT